MVSENNSTRYAMPQVLEQVLARALAGLLQRYQTGVSGLRRVSYDYIEESREYDINWALTSGESLHLRLSVALLTQVAREIGRRGSDASLMLSVADCASRVYERCAEDQRVVNELRPLRETLEDAYRLQANAQTIEHARRNLAFATEHARRNHNYGLAQMLGSGYMTPDEIRQQNALASVQTNAQMNAYAQTQNELLNNPQINAAARQLCRIDIQFGALYIRPEWGVDWPTSNAEALAKATELLRRNLSEKQLAEYDGSPGKFFHVKGSDSGKCYRIKYGSSMNIEELRGKDDSEPVCRWCVLPEGGLCEPDIMLAQKIALEGRERETLKIANKSEVWPRPDTRAEHWYRRLMSQW